MRILLTRHGQTDYNVQKRLQGRADIPLNSRGIEQAQTIHKLAIDKGIIPTRVISSPLVRAVQTGSIISGLSETDVEIMPDLIEMSFGILEGHNMVKEDPKYLESFFDKPDTYVPPKGGESYEDLFARVECVIESIRKQIYDNAFSENEVVLLVSHGAFCHGILSYLSNAPLKSYWYVDFNNCAIAELFLSEDGKADSYEFLFQGFEKNW